MRVVGSDDLSRAIKSTLAKKGPYLCEVMVDPQMQVVPRAGFQKLANGTFAARPLDDMFPHLPESERDKLMRAPGK